MLCTFNAAAMFFHAIPNIWSTTVLHDTYIHLCTVFGPEGHGMCSRWRPTSYRDATFVLLVHKGSEIWTSLSLQVSLLQLQQSLCSFCVSRDVTAGDGRYMERAM